MLSLLRKQISSKLSSNSKILKTCNRSTSRIVSYSTSNIASQNVTNNKSYYTLASVSAIIGFSALMLVNEKTHADNTNKSNIIDGKAIANQIHIELAQSVKEIQKNYGVTPGLAVILVGERKDSQSYVKSKKKACADIGMTSFGYDYPADVTEAELIKKIDELNAGISIIHCNDIHDYLITSLSSYI